MTKEKEEIKTCIYNGYTYINIRLIDINKKRDEVNIEINNAGYKQTETTDIFRDKYNRPYFEYENKRIYL